jgi:hypothetical protein
MEVSQVKQLKDLERELAHYQKIVADLTLQNVVLKDVIEISFSSCRKAEGHLICLPRLHFNVPESAQQQK